MSAKPLPTIDDLKYLLNFISPEDQTTWVNVTHALSHSYNQDKAVFDQVLVPWASAASNRDKNSEAREKYNYFSKAGAGAGYTVGTVIHLARQHGATYPRARIQAPAQRNEFSGIADAPVITIDTGIANAEAAPDAPAMERQAIAMMRSSLRAVLAFCVFDCANTVDAERTGLLNNNVDGFKHLPKAERACFNAVHQYCTAVNKDTFSSEGFIAWAASNPDLPEACPKTLEGWARICQSDFSGVVDVVSADHALNDGINRAKLLALRFQLSKACENTLNAACSENLETALESVRKSISQLSAAAADTDQSIKTDTGIDIASAATRNILDAVMPDRRINQYVPTGHALIDGLIQGYRRKEVTLFSAHSGVGKTWWGIDAARIALQMGLHVVFCSTEMDNDSLAGRFAENLNQKTAHQLAAEVVHSGLGVNSPELGAYVESLRDFLTRYPDFSIVGTHMGTLSIDQIGQELARLSQKRPIDLVIVDYLQNVANDSFGGRNVPFYQVVMNTMERLTAMSAEHNCATIALAQLNNPNRKQGSRDVTPGLYDIADATGVVRAAAAVLAMYQIDISDSKDDGPQIVTRMKVNKARYGSCTAAPLQVKRLVGSRFHLLA